MKYGCPSKRCAKIFDNEVAYNIHWLGEHARIPKPLTDEASDEPD